jgi:Cu(I)/Ag(I) efflux system protein CusF
MKRFVVLSFVVAALVAAVPASRAQMGGMGGMDMKDKDMSKCKDMMDKGQMGMKGMDMPKECKDMMDKQGMDMKGKTGDKKSQAKSHKGVGVVKSIDSAGGKVTLAHDPIQSMNWPAMSMTFTVKDKKMLGKLQRERKVEFQFVQQGSDYVITRIK